MVTTMTSGVVPVPLFSTSMAVTWMMFAVTLNSFNSAARASIIVSWADLAARYTPRLAGGLATVEGEMVMTRPHPFLERGSSKALNKLKVVRTC